MKNKLKCAIYGFILTLVLSACGGPLNKSVTEPLTPEEAEIIAQKYDNFIGVYEHLIFPAVDKLQDNSLFRQKLKKLTYREFMEFENLTFNNDWEGQLSQEWEQKYDMDKLTRKLDSMVDSIIGYWENYIIENAPSTYVSVELIEITKSVSQSWGGARSLNASARLKVVPLRGKIDKLTVNYTLFHADKADPDAYTIGNQLGTGKIEIGTPFDAPIVVETKLRVSVGYPGIGSWYDYVCDTPTEIIVRQCKLHLNSLDLTIKGERINLMELLEKKPSYLSGYKKSKSDTSSSNYKLYREEFIKEYIDKDYADKPHYIFNRKQQMLYEYSPLAFSLFYGEEATKRFLREWGKESEN